jgi:hypothetical protein
MIYIKGVLIYTILEWFWNSSDSNHTYGLFQPNQMLRWVNVLIISLYDFVLLTKQEKQLSIHIGLFIFLQNTAALLKQCP